MITIELLRQFRIGGFAVFDFSLAFVGILLISPLLTRLFRLVKLEIPLISWMFFTLPIAVITHILINLYTPLTKQILDLHGFYLEKIVLILLIAAGIKYIKVIKKPGISRAKK